MMWRGIAFSIAWALGIFLVGLWYLPSVLPEPAWTWVAVAATPILLVAVLYYLCEAFARRK